MTEHRKLAIVGAGPKGLYCLERLAAELCRNDDIAPFEVHIFETHPVPGAGPVYDPNQPDYLRMNFTSGKIDMWERNDEFADVHEAPLTTFVDHLATCGLVASGVDYAPRRLVGAYLSAGFDRLVEALRASATVVIHNEAVLSIERRGRAFELRTPAQSLTCSDVLIATGHGSRMSPASAGITPYPIDQPGGVGDITPGASVAVRGLGLTAIDVALALTEGRGGRFVPNTVPGRFTYEASGFEAATILPFSRTGRPMVPKPHPVLMPETDAVVAACELGSRSIDAFAEFGRGSVLDVVVETSASILCSVIGKIGCDELVHRHLESLLSREPVDDDVRVEMHRAVEIAFGRGTPGPDWALGVCWRGIYPALVRLVATRRLDDDWPDFADLATEMERVSFGPPAENAARMLALVEAGIIDMTCASGPVIAETDGCMILRTAEADRNVDVLVNAVLDPPGAAPHPSPLVASLLASGLARKTAHSSGLDVGPDGTCFSDDGEPTVGLAAVGRPTEGSILGNDTLSRHLHDTPALWARATMRRFRVPMEASAA